MLTYDDLTPGRKKWVHLVEHFHPEVGQTITFEQMKRFDSEFRSLRTKDPKFKVSMPLWLIGSNAISRGVYFFPSSKNDETSLLEEQKIDVGMDLLYKKTLASYGINKI